MQIIIFALFETAAAFYMNKNQASVSVSQINSLIFKRIRVSSPFLILLYFLNSRLS
ncbi:hypothetical protein QSI_1085 [Clostridioides difficile P28]|nr:hypothetical protein QSI_1085 [Clostridioides difficile P28]